MSSFRELFKLAREQPERAALLINRAALSETPYPTSVAAIYLVGVLNGFCMGRAFADNYNYALDQVLEGHGDIVDLIKPKEVIGESRVFHRRRK